MSGTSERRQRFLQEMGLGPVWTLRQRASQDEAGATDAPLEAGDPSLISDAGVPDAVVPAAVMPDAVAAELVAAPACTTGSAPAASEVSQMDWEQLQESVASCVKCGLCQGRTKTVFGVGARKAKWLFVGEGPGRNEDLQGEPFVGPAGKLLDNMLAALDLKRGVNAYIANIVKCRPTDSNGRDRPPTPTEMAACLPYLERQIELIQPTVIVALGKTAAIALLGADPETPVSKLRGSVHRYAGRPLVITYHPAYLLRTLQDKAKAWRDLCLAMDAFAGADA